MDPYKVLGISQNATEEEVRIAYKNLVSEYSLTKYKNTPNEPLAKDILDNANASYELLINGNIYKEIRALIDNKNFTVAETKLNLISDKNSPEWNYLSGFVFLSKGWFDSAVYHLTTAIEPNPDNTEYLDTLDTLKSRASEFANYYKQKNVKPNTNNMNPCGGGSGGAQGSGMGGMC